MVSKMDELTNQVAVDTCPRCKRRFSTNPKNNDRHPSHYGDVIVCWGCYVTEHMESTKTGMNGQKLEFGHADFTGERYWPVSE